MKNIGIIGYGSFGSLLAKLVAQYVSALVYDTATITSELPENVRIADMKKIANCDVIVIATDLSGVASVCKLLAPLVKPSTIVMDICSVKVKPAAIMIKLLGSKCCLLATHPMFGPNSVAANGNTCKGLTLVWHELAGEPFPELEELFGSKLRAKIQRMTPDEHDQQMAWAHALTFFVGRALVDMDIPNLTLDTGYYQKLRDLFDLEKTHSRALFDTIEAGNPYAAAVRAQLMATLQRLDTEVKELHYE